MSTQSTDSRFATDNLSVFERHGATVEARPKRAGCSVTLPNGWVLSVQWGPCMYGSNYDSLHLDGDESALTATTAEIAVISKGGGTLVTWADGDIVQGWCSMDRVLHVLDLLADDKLIVHGVADDGSWPGLRLSQSRSAAVAVQRHAIVRHRSPLTDSPTHVDPARLRGLVRDLAESHDHCSSPELRGRARSLLGLGECRPEQGCILRGGCENCGRARP